MRGNRKMIAFLITLVACIALSVLGKDTTGAVAVFATYCAGNVGAKITGRLSNAEQSGK